MYRVTQKKQNPYIFVEVIMGFVFWSLSLSLYIYISLRKSKNQSHQDYKFISILFWVLI